MKNLQRNILILIILLFVISVIIAIVLLNLRKEQTEDINNDIFKIEEIESEQGINLLNNYNIYYTILGYITDFYNSIIEKDTDKIYGLLSSEYITSNSINKENIYSNITKIDIDMTYYKIDHIYEEETETYLIYYINGNLIDRNTQSKYKNTYLIFYVDKANSTFSILPIEKSEYEKYIQFGIKTEYKEIKSNSYNKYKINLIQDTNIVETLIYDYKDRIINQPELSYDLFDKEYRDIRFGSLNNYKKYVEKNKDEISKIRPESYLINYEDGYTEYVVKDQYDNLYIFDETAVLEYTVKLDTYTLEQEKFNTAYKSATNREKAMMNIDKFFQMINANDYTTSYKLLNDNFKATYFPTEERFEQFMRQYVYTHANITYSNFSDDISGVFTYHLELTDKANANNPVIKMNMVIQLLEGTDYRLSFELLQ